jgi:protein-disulfide isomerase
MKRFTLLVLLAALALPVAAGAQGVDEKRYQIPLENSPSVGPADAPVTMVEFLDFQ